MADFHSNFTGPEIDAALARAKAGGAIDEALAGKAPAGYGLGTDSTKITDFDTALTNGFFGSESDSVNGPFDGFIGLVFVHSSYAGTTHMVRQDAYRRLSGSPEHYVRHCIGGTWKEWEFENPPMALGVEYRTTERYLGKPVYVKAVSVGAMPAASGASNRIKVDFNPSNLEKIVRWEGTVTDGTMVCTLPVHASNGMVVGLYGYWYSGMIYIESNGDYSGYSGTLTFWYTKTTD